MENAEEVKNVESTQEATVSNDSNVEKNVENKDIEEQKATDQKTVEQTNNTKEQPVKKKVRPKLFANPNSEITVTAIGYYNSETGELEFALPESDENNGEVNGSDQFIIQKNTFIFSRIPYNRLNVYRSRSGKYNPDDKSTTIDFIKFRNFIWTFHLKDWNLEDDDGNKIEIKHDIDGTLSEESEKMLWNVPAVILDIVIQMYENKLNLL